MGQVFYEVPIREEVAVPSWAGDREDLFLRPDRASRPSCGRIWLFHEVSEPPCPLPKDARIAEAYCLVRMRGMVRAFALLFLCSGLPAPCVEVAWVRILSGDAEPVIWKSGEGWPARPSGFPFAPSAVLSYATISPGDAMTEADLEERARTWERELDESGRFSRSSVMVAELGDGTDSRGIVVEVETGDTPLFGGGEAYVSAALPLLDGRRTTLGVQAGPNLGSIAFRDEVLEDMPLGFDSRLAYAKDLL